MPTTHTTTDLTTTTPAELRAEAAHFEQASRDSFDRCDTDGFLTQWACDKTAQLKRRQADLAEAGGMAKFPALYDLDGNRVPAKLIAGKYGPCWALVDDRGRYVGTFISARPKRAATMAKKGYREGFEMAPATAELAGTSAVNVYVAVTRTDDGTGRDPRVVAIAPEVEA